MPRWQDIKISLRARGQILSLVPFPLSGSDPQNPSFLHPATRMATYQHNPLFTIQKLGIPGAAATKISILRYPESSIKQQSSSKAAKQRSNVAAKQQGAKPAAKQPSWYHDAEISRFLSGSAAVLRTSIYMHITGNFALLHLTMSG